MAGNCWYMWQFKLPTLFKSDVCRDRVEPFQTLSGPGASGNSAAVCALPTALPQFFLIVVGDLRRQVLACGRDAPLLVCGECPRRHALQPLHAEAGVGHHGGGGRVDAHGGVRGLEHVGQVKHRAAVAAVHDDSEAHVLWQRAHQVLQNLVVTDLPRLLVIHGDDGLVQPVFLVTVVVLHLPAVTAVMHKQRIARPRAVAQPFERRHYVGRGGAQVEAVVLQDLEAFRALLESLFD
mmetsp:Transcript_5934/g.10275  ORF Transcript_5934/g.10275 Transcript_5934/m.10275 type:complete len:236 (+) Transcript_5934:138-845(+)